MSQAWTLVVGCAVITFAIKAAGPIALGGRALPRWFASVVALMPAALLAALVAEHTLTDGHRVAVGPATVGVAVAGAVMWRTRSIPACVVTAALVTALLRAL